MKLFIKFFYIRILVKATLVPEKSDIFLGKLPIVILSLPNFEFIISIVSDKLFLFYSVFKVII